MSINRKSEKFYEHCEIFHSHTTHLHSIPLDNIECSMSNHFFLEFICVGKMEFYLDTTADVCLRKIETSVALFLSSSLENLEMKIQCVVKRKKKNFQVVYCVEWNGGCCGAFCRVFVFLFNKTLCPKLIET